LLLPGIALLILAALYLLLIVASLPGQTVRMQAVDTSTPAGAGELAGMIVTLVALTLMNVAIVLGAISMLRLKNYRSAYTAAVLSLIPFCSPCFVLGIPFGIWALIVLHRADVKQRFLMA